MHLEIWETLAGNAAVHQGWCLHRQVALEQKCSFEANAVLFSLAAGWLWHRVPEVLTSSSPVREHHLGSNTCVGGCLGRREAD